MEEEKVEDKWEVTTNRFVAFFDIMGFKELVERNEHKVVLKKLELLKTALTFNSKINEY